MRFFSTTLPLLLFCAFATAQPAMPTDKEIAIDNLLSERGSDKAFEEVVSEARKSGVGEQAILEARFLYHVDRREDGAIAALLPEFVRQQEHFKIGDSAIFAVKEDWLAVVQYVRAIDALKKSDKAGFKTHITEAFWLSPRQASAFAPHIDRLRLEEAMGSVKIDFQTRLISLQDGEAVALTKLIEGRKAMLLHFWSPASPECEASLPDYAITARDLMEKGVAMVSILPGGTPEHLAKARGMIRPLGATPPGAWLIDTAESPLAADLRVQTLPLFALISNEGRVLFNGDPSDEALWDALVRIDASIARPRTVGADE
jgi:hypothetical protein